MDRFASTFCGGADAGLTTRATERDGALRETRLSWALVVLLSLATMAVAGSTSVVHSESDGPAFTTR